MGNVSLPEHMPFITEKCFIFLQEALALKTKSIHQLCYKRLQTPLAHSEPSPVPTEKKDKKTKGPDISKICSPSTISPVGRGRKKGKKGPRRWRAEGRAAPGAPGGGRRSALPPPRIPGAPRPARTARPRGGHSPQRPCAAPAPRPRQVPGRYRRRGAGRRWARGKAPGTAPVGVTGGRLAPGEGRQAPPAAPVPSAALRRPAPRSPTAPPGGDRRRPPPPAAAFP